MRIAITGGTGFVGRRLARDLVALGHEALLVARGVDRRDAALREQPGVSFVASDLGDATLLERAFAGCDAVAHLAGINREIGRQTFERVHVQGTRHVVEAAERAGVNRIALLSFLRARPGCGSPYHESKWEAEEIVRASSLDWTILKAGVIYGRGDHMLDHLARGILTFPIFPLVGIRPRRFRPAAVEDVSRILVASLVNGRLPRRTAAVTGPEEMPFREGIERVARVLGKRPLIVGSPVFLQRILAQIFEWAMATPLASKAQARILAEGLVDPAPPCDALPEELRPRTPFSDEKIRAGLPERKRFGLGDLRFCE